MYHTYRLLKHNQQLYWQVYTCFGEKTNSGGRQSRPTLLVLQRHVSPQNGAIEKRAISVPTAPVPCAKALLTGSHCDENYMNRQTWRIVYSDLTPTLIHAPSATNSNNKFVHIPLWIDRTSAKRPMKRKTNGAVRILDRRVAMMAYELKPLTSKALLQRRVSSLRPLRSTQELRPMKRVSTVHGGNGNNWSSQQAYPKPAPTHLPRNKNGEFQSKLRNQTGNAIKKQQQKLEK